jgi:hypothetical protein
MADETWKTDSKVRLVDYLQIGLDVQCWTLWERDNMVISPEAVPLPWSI